MAEQIAVPTGVNPANAIPSDATVHQRSHVDPAAVPAVPPANQQQPGFQPAATAPSGSDAAEFAAFQAWKAQQAGATPAVAPGAEKKPAAPAPQAPARTPGFEGMGGDAALAAAQTAAQADHYLASTFSVFEMVAPDVDLARAVGNALDRGDPTLIDVAYITEKAGDKAAKLIEVAKGLVSHVTSTVENLTKDIYSKAGGEAQWHASVEVFNTKAPQYLKEFVASGVDSANPAKISTAVAALLDFVKQSGSLPVAPEGHVRAGGGAANAALGLSKAEYQAERMKLDRRSRDFGDQERELTARRQLGKQQGK